MSLFNDPSWIGFDGQPITGRVPPVTYVTSDTPGVEMTPQQRGVVQHAFKLFCDAVAVSSFPDGFHVQHRDYPDGMKVRMESNGGQQRVFVGVTGGERQEVDEDLVYCTWTSRSTKVLVNHPYGPYYGRYNNNIIGSTIGVSPTGPDGYYRRADNLYLGPVTAISGSFPNYYGNHTEYPFTVESDGYYSPYTGFLEDLNYIGAGDYLLNWCFVGARSRRITNRGRLNLTLAGLNSTLAQYVRGGNEQNNPRGKTPTAFIQSGSETVLRLAEQLVGGSNLFDRSIFLSLTGLSPTVQEVWYLPHTYHDGRRYIGTVGYMRYPAIHSNAWSGRIWSLPQTSIPDLTGNKWAEVLCDPICIVPSQNHIFVSGPSGWFVDPGGGSSVVMYRFDKDLNYLSRHRFTLGGIGKTTDNTGGIETTSDSVFADDGVFGIVGEPPDTDTGEMSAALWRFTTDDVPTVWQNADSTFPVMREDENGAAKYYSSLHTAHVASGGELFVASASEYYDPVSGGGKADHKVLLHVYSTAQANVGQKTATIRLDIEPEDYITSYYNPQLGVVRRKT